MKVAVIIPCYKVKKHILSVLEKIPDSVSAIFVVDDACPEETGKYAESHCQDPRLRVIFSSENKGVGGAVVSGYEAALKANLDILVKIDGDDQMDPTLIDRFIRPIQNGECDYSKGNRFWNLEFVRSMPKIRLFGNAILSLMTKFSSGYWHIFDPTNGYTALHRDAAKQLPFDQISHRYFFESDMLFRLNTIRAVVVDVPMVAKYENEESNLKISKVLGEFLYKQIRNFIKRIFYNYYLRDMSIASLELPLGIAMVFFGVVYGGLSWIASAGNGVPTPPGTVMLAALPLLMGLQLILAFFNYDTSSAPQRPIQVKMRNIRA